MSITGVKDNVGDVIMPGAYEKSLKVRKPKGVWHHSWTDPIAKTLDIKGVGYRAAAQGKKLKLQLGYSHDVDLDVPEGLEVKTPDQTTVEVSGIDKQAVGQFAAEIRRWRKPEPYKGKGIAYRGEYIFRKEGKKK